MTDSTVVSVQGAKRVKATMRDAAREIEKSERAVDRYGKLLAETAQGKAPVRSGRLRAGIVAHGQKVIASVPYSAAQEYGVRRRGIPGKYYMRKAIDATQRKVVVIFTEETQHELDQIKGA